MKQNQKKSLSTIEMTDALDLFNTVLLETRNSKRFLAPETKKEIDDWIDKITSMIPLFNFRINAIEDINNTIFSSEDIRTFVLDLYFNFFSIYNEVDSDLDYLLSNLKNGFNIDEGKFSIIPTNVRQSFMNSVFTDMYRELEFKFLFIRFRYKRKITFEEFLKSNKHFILVIMISLVNQ